jgi:ribosomal protein S27AE
MDGNSKARRERWMQRAEAAYRRMFEGKSAEELVTLTQRESMAVLIGKELAAFLLEEHVAMDPAAEPVEASATCCPKCGQPGRRAAEEEELPERRVTTRVGQIGVRRQRWQCGKCRIIFFSVGRQAGLGDGRL